ncbi:transcription factor bHLH111 isoform X2 [Corylus avellana]|uniref:transcription factor bHLH111 isoform X2 n=1 Tax=Corylus avellana TaxID=13451 RepID=UPI00286AF1CC|nr:transcription factor bHLH111 isoform X2 [Corylus avellana]
MGEECTEESSVATSSSTPAPNWWDLSSWNNSNPWHNQDPNSNSSCDEDVSISTSFTNASNHSALTVESSRPFFEPASSNELIPEHASDSHLWSHVFLSSVGSNQDVEEKFVDALSSKSMSTGMFEPACNYLKKFTNSCSSSNNFDKNICGGFGESLVDNERLSKLSNLVSTWSIAPPACDASLNSSMDPTTLYSCYGDDFKVGNESRESAALLPRPFNSSLVGDIRSFADIISFTSRIAKPLVDIHSPNHSFKSINSSLHKKQGLQTSSLLTNSTCSKQTRINGKGQGTANEGKRKRFEDGSESVLKKAKHESPIASSVKVQAPKVKLGDRITALQQIVSPFGKTDTASVLFEAIQYIKFLQEQVQDPWGGLDRKDKGDTKPDLGSRGLCLVPISFTPQIYRENAGSDYWSTPAYRGCLYR